MSLMKAVQITSPGSDFKLVQIEIPEPEENGVLIRVEACGICHGDSAVKDGRFPGLKYPRIPGHEVVGIIEKTGARVTGWKKGDRVGSGWHGGHCFTCSACRRGNFGACENTLITGITIDGGYAEFMAARAEALVSIPDELSSVDAAPIVCGGRTTFGALKNSNAKPGDLVAIHGLGGLGHMGLQYAVKMGFKTVVVSRGKDKEELAFRLGAHFYIDAKSADAAKELKKLGGAKTILCTAPNGKAISELLPGLGAGGQAIIVTGANDAIQFPASMLLGGGRSIKGSVEGNIEDAINFSLLHNIKPMIEVFPLEQAAIAYDKMINSKVNFRSVLKIS